MVVILSFGLAAVLWRIFKYFGEAPTPAGTQVIARTVTTTTIGTQTTGLYNTFPDAVFITNTGTHYHLGRGCGGLSGSRTTRAVTFCQTCSDQVRTT